MVSRLSGARLAFQVARVDVPLASLQARFEAEGNRQLRAPPVAIPDLGQALELAPIRQLALKELISHARTGRCTLHLPIPIVDRSVMGVRLHIPAGHSAVIDLAFEDGRLLRENVRGPIEPPIALPLGLTAEAVYLDKDGAVWVDIPRFPDLKLTYVGLARVPGTVDEALDAYLSDDAAEPSPAPAPEPAEGALQMDMSRLVAEARNVIPRSDPFHLGSAGQLSLGQDTRLDVDYSADRLGVRGRLQMLDGELKGRAFSLEGLHGHGTLTSSLDGLEELRGLAIDLRIHEGHVGRLALALPDGSRLEVADARVEGAEVTYSRRQDKERFRFTARRVAGRLKGATVVLHIGEQAHPVHVGSLEFDGALTVSDRFFDLDLDVVGARLDTRGLDLELGLARLALGDFVATASGRIKVSTDYGYSFSGHLHGEGDVLSGGVALGPLGAGLTSGTRGELFVSELAGGPEGLDALVATGRFDVELASGSLPLGPNAQLSFSRGGRGAVELKQVRLTPDSRWPHVVASGRIVAQADPAVVEGIFQIPAGQAHVEVQEMVLDETGHLTVEDLRCWLSSDE